MKTFQEWADRHGFIDTPDSRSCYATYREEVERFNSIEIYCDSPPTYPHCTNCDWVFPPKEPFCPACKFRRPPGRDGRPTP